MQMPLRNLGLVPKGLLVQFEGVPSLVRPKVEYLDRQAREMPVLARQDGLHQLYTNDLTPIYRQLKAGKDDGYSSLAGKQPLVLSDNVSKDAMADVLSRFGDEVFNKYAIWAELGPDWQPEKRTKGYELKDANAVLYRNWGLSGDGIDVSKAQTIPVKWMEKSGDVSKEIVGQLGVPEDTYVWADRKGAVNSYDGLNALLWDFRRERPDLGSYGEPQYWGSYGGALLGSRLSADEMVKNLYSSS